MHATGSAIRISPFIIAAYAAGVFAAAVLSAQDTRTGATVNRIRETGKIRLGYRDDARPFSFKSESGQAAGYSVALCQRVAESVKNDLHLSGLAVEWVQTTVDDRFGAVQQGQIDLLCAAPTVTLARRQDVGFSVPIFPGGVGAVIRADAPARLRDVLAGRGQVFRPTWRASATQVLQARAFSVISGTTAEKWVNERMNDLEIIAKVAPVSSYDAGMSALLDRTSDVFFGERAILMDAAKRSPASRNLTIVDRLFTFEPLALAMARGDDDFRLLVDRALSRIYRSGEIGTLYTNSFGEPDENALTFFQWNALPE